jgi:hypothetical protein
LGSSRSSAEAACSFDGSRRTIASPGSRCTHRVEQAAQVSQRSEIRMRSSEPQTGQPIDPVPCFVSPPRLCDENGNPAGRRCMQDGNFRLPLTRPCGPPWGVESRPSLGGLQQRNRPPDGPEGLFEGDGVRGYCLARGPLNSMSGPPVPPSVALTSERVNANTRVAWATASDIWLIAVVLTFVIVSQAWW